LFIKKPENHYRVVIVGSGPAGLSLAQRLSRNGHSGILVVESGQLEYDQKQNHLGQIEAQGDLPSSYFQQHSPRLFGGASALWGGFCAVLEERNFSEGLWPFPYTEVSRYYADAATILELPDSAWQKRIVPIDNSDDIVYRPFYLSPPVRFGEKFLPLASESESFSVLTGHTITRVNVDDGRVRNLNIADQDGHEIQVSADFCVLAAGGIQNARLLQLSNLGGQHCGKHFIDHPHIYGYGKIMVNKAIVNASRQTSGRRVDALQLSDAFCIRHKIPSISVMLNDGRDDRGLADAGDGMLQLNVDILGEMASGGSNRIYLSANHDDWLKQAYTAIDFQFDYRSALKKAWLLFGEALLRSGLGRVSSYSDDYSLTGGGHMIGTTRMGRSLADSVVDVDCKVHGTEDLYVSGSSVFPSGGSVNPTFTLVALAVRLAEHLSTRLKT